MLRCEEIEADTVVISHVCEENSKGTASQHRRNSKEEQH
jgi:hypothetical protein